MLPPEKISRPILLTWLCIASAGFGVAWIIMFIVLITFSVRGIVPSGLFPGIVIQYLHAGYLFIGAEIALTGFGLTGVVMMWKIKKTGFYLYAFMKAIIYFLPVVFIGSDHLTFPALLISSILIVVYGILITGTLKR
jgi:hypothetical protein